MMHARSQLDDVRASVKVKEDIFKSNKGYEEHLYNQLKSQQSEATVNELKRRELENQAIDVLELRNQSKIAKHERDRMQADYDELIRQPFFKEMVDESKKSEYAYLQNAIDQFDKEEKKLRSLIHKHNVET